MFPRNVVVEWLALRSQVQLPPTEVFVVSSVPPYNVRTTGISFDVSLNLLSTDHLLVPRLTIREVNIAAEN
jgi:hypothetical protein